MSDYPTPPPPVPAPPKKGIPALGWVGIGCGTIIIILVILVSLAVGFCRKTIQEFEKNPEKAAAEMIIRANPDLELVKSDDKAGEITVRRKDGKTMTFTYEQIREGKFSMTDSDGNVTEIGASDLSNVPSWVPRVPNAEGKVNAFQNTSDAEISGSYTTESSATPEEIEAFFEAEADKLGFNSHSSSNSTFNDMMTRVSTYSGGKRKLTLTLTSSSGKPLMAQVGYSEKK
ncbi:hypothetical protein JIN85_08445 [Luteolibacter pohnpeiensis]|uniref:Uncharacterized protein n=1 Tax=Luteolibacter pohnpeiensis TaxID=454153 RepID=A0A934VQT3_9BACT|nr:hypothetical protein [Luteolibacter pohnpeiensis]MBK1882441.1 hypothetical protein [Luteolibacter pohnpeiensis]